MPDTSHPAPLTRLAFGSCSNARKGRQSDVWDAVAARQPELWVWTGDAVYAKGGTGSSEKALDRVKDAYGQMLGATLGRWAANTTGDSAYASFARSLPLPVVGTWDDHDLGRNDGGRHVPRLPERQAAFLDFLGVPAGSTLRARHGVFAHHVYGPPDRRVSLILVDTRTSRDDHVVPSVAWYMDTTPLSTFWALLAACIRFASAYSGLTALGDRRGRQMLGEEQWTWLARALAEPANATLLVSSVQVVATTPTTESWGHFPRERTRLLRLLREADPAGLVIVSGDVHVAEVLGLPGLPDLEVTSSGLTHSCADSLKVQALCDLVWSFGGEHRRGVFVGRNWADVSVDWEGEKVTVEVRSLEEGSRGEVVLSVERGMGVRATELIPADVDGVQGVVPGPAWIAAFYLAVLAVLIALVAVTRWHFGSRRRSAKRKAE
ncbi:PhoD-like phosphatase-domain-containing protein [Hyaloraphidium curvatum]|nr:PhoD-like phosphatase-domain-containing protein [Hyaloraphidium curvatum]